MDPEGLGGVGVVELATPLGVDAAKKESPRDSPARDRHVSAGRRTEAAVRERGGAQGRAEPSRAGPSGATAPRQAGEQRTERGPERSSLCLLLTINQAVGKHRGSFAK